jgi:hypothetical protein
MLYPTTLLLWAILCSPPSNTSGASAAFSAAASGSLCPQAALHPFLSDSTIFKDIQASLESYQQTYPQEKLYLHLDRTLLNPGETIWFNAFLLNAGDLLPSIQSQMLQVDLLDVRSSVIQSKKYLALNGVAAGEFDFPADLPGGRYKIKAYTNWMQNFGACFERDITLQKVVIPRVNLKLEFERKGLGSRDIAIARFDASGLDNHPVADRKLSFTASIGGQVVHTGESITDANGRAYVRFQLPDKLETADGLLNIQLEHGGQMEAISRPIPIILNKIDLQFFPEGGDAVAGLSCRMAFKAVNEFGKPADVQGIILDSKGVQVAEFSSFHDGMGAFEFLPKAGESYEARVTRPFVANEAIQLPLALPGGYGLRLQKRDAKHLTFQVSATKSEKVYLVGQSEDKLFFFKELTPQNGGETLVKIPTTNLPIGIARFTLFDQNKTALLERLAFVNRDQGLKIELQPDKSQYLPREKVTLKIQVTDRAGKPAQGNFSLAVTDERLLSYADDKQGHLLASLLLEQAVKGPIETPNFYFDTTESKSEQALDYLLMTQGWRRFEWSKVLKNEPVNCLFPAERAAITGTILRKNNKPAQHVKIALYPNGPVTKTDINGHFSFEKVNVEQYTQLKYLKDQYYPLNGYRNYILYDAGKKKQYHAPLRNTPSGNGSTYLCGIISDELEPLIGASVKALRGTDFVRGAICDMDGRFRLTLDPGIYNLEISYTGYETHQVSGVQVLSGKINFLPDVIMSSRNNLMEINISEFIVPLIEQDNISVGRALTSDQIKNIPTRSVNAIIATTAGTTAIDGGDVNIKGSRANATNYYIDGIRVSGKALPAQELAESLQRKGYTAPRRQPIFSQSRVFYVPQYSTVQAPIERTDFRPTIYWNPNIQTDKRGAAQVEFYTSDAITNFRATLEGLSADGQPGRCEQKFFAQKPVAISLKVAPSIMSGDVLNLKVAISNNSKYPAGGRLSISVPAHFSPVSETLLEGMLSVSVGAGETKVISMPYKIGLQTTEDHAISIKLSADEIILDAYETSIRTINTGYPANQVAGGFGAQTTFNIRLNEPVEGTVSATLTAYPSPLEDLLKSMERMLQQPIGCFEQVSSSNYPNLLVLDLLRQTSATKPELETRALSLLEDGYKKLTAYESKSGGFDWWGRDPAHEGLTAYGILEFTDMAKVFPVDKAMIARTVKWLSSRRDEQGGWTLNPSSLHGWQNDPVLDCYIVWALAEAGYGQEFTKELEHAKQKAIQSNDPYQMALLANALLALGDADGKKLLTQLLAQQEENGSWIGKSHSVMYAHGDCFRIETTALAALALTKAGKKTAELQKAMDFLIGSKTEYGYGSTQSTVMALKALIEFVKLDNKEASDGHFTVTIDGQKAGDFSFSTKSSNKLEIKHLERFFKTENPRVSVVFEDKKTVIPFDLEIKYASRLPQNSATCPLSLVTQLDKKTANTGETVRLSATVKNNSSEVQASPMVVLGVPSGLSLQPWQLKKLMDEKKCDFYELWDGFAVFHFEHLSPGESRDLHLDLRADIAGIFEAPASQAFLYYSNDQRVWSKPEKLEIK